MKNKTFISLTNHWEEAAPCSFKDPHLLHLSALLSWEGWLLPPVGNQHPWLQAPFTIYDEEEEERSCHVHLCGHRSYPTVWQLFIEPSCVWQCVRRGVEWLIQKLYISGTLVNPADPNRRLLLPRVSFSTLHMAGSAQRGDFSNPCPLTAVPLTPFLLVHSVRYLYLYLSSIFIYSHILYIHIYMYTHTMYFGEHTM